MTSVLALFVACFQVQVASIGTQSFAIVTNSTYLYIMFLVTASLSGAVVVVCSAVFVSYTRPVGGALGMEGAALPTPPLRIWRSIREIGGKHT